MTRRVVVGVILSAFVLAGSCIDKANSDEDARAQACADRLGIRWTLEDGATEQLRAFKVCVG